MSKNSAQHTNNYWSITEPGAMNCHDHMDDENHKHSSSQAYRPFHVSSDPQNDAFLDTLTKIPSARSMVDIEGNNLLIAFHGDTPANKLTKTKYRLLGAIPPLIGACFVRK